MESLAKILDSIEMKVTKFLWDLVGVGLILIFLYSIVENKDHNYLRG